MGGAIWVRGGARVRDRARQAWARLRILRMLSFLSPVLASLPSRSNPCLCKGAFTLSSLWSSLCPFSVGGERPGAVF